MDSLLLPLRSSSSKDSLSNSLPFIIPQINAQRGGFRHISEQSLAEEISNLTSASDTDDNEEETPTEDYNDRRTKLYEKKAEMLQEVGEAHNSALMAVDFISLLLSGPGGKGEQTMSPYLKEHVPTGSMGVQVIETAGDDTKRQVELVSKGWRLESFGSAADSLLRSASRLEEEISRETNYWEQVLAVKEKGWTVCRVPQERHTLGVKYGFREASSTYRNRGIAALRREEDGKIILDRGPLAPPPKSVRVQIKTRGNITGTSTFIPRPGESIEDRILEARNAIYDEELFFELGREARALISYGVEIRQNTIQFRHGDDKLILISLEPTETITADPKPDSDLATSLLVILRLLLSHIHRQNYNSRTSDKVALNNQTRPNATHALIRPILSFLQHISHLYKTVDVLDILFSPLKPAGLPHTIQKFPFTSTNISTLTSSDSLIAALSSTLESSFTLTLPSSDKATLILTIKTSLVPPTQGTEYAVQTSHLTTLGVHIPPKIPRITSREEIRQMVSRILNLDLIATVSSISEGLSKAQMTTNGVAQRTGKKSTKRSKVASWYPTDPQSCELKKTIPSTGNVAIMHIVLEEGSLKVDWSWETEAEGGDEYVWKSKVKDEDVEMAGDGKTLEEFLKGAAV
jgi:mediator of RNA polymerase II transcription subunit 17